MQDGRLGAGRRALQGETFQFRAGGVDGIGWPETDEDGRALLGTAGKG